MRLVGRAGVAVGLGADDRGARVLAEHRVLDLLLRVAGQRRLVRARAAEAVTAPKASRKNGTYSSSGSLTVKLTAEKGADIYYSTGGTYKAEDSTESSIAIAPAHAVMLEGVIYYDTGTVSGTDAKAAPDGTMTSPVDSGSFPTEDGQSNYGTGYAYRYGSENGTLEVQIDGEWWIFAVNQ